MKTSLNFVQNSIKNLDKTYVRDVERKNVILARKIVSTQNTSNGNVTAGSQLSAGGKRASLLFSRGAKGFSRNT